MRTNDSRRLGATLIATLSIAAPAAAQSFAPASDGVGLEQRLSARIPLDLPFTDESGRPVVLGAYFQEQPVVLVPVYYSCPMLCTQVLNALLRTLRQVRLDAGTHFQVIVFSIDPREQPPLAAQKKLQYLRQYDRAGADRGWHFLTSSETSIAALTEAIGFRFQYVPARDEYAHPAAIVLLSKDGMINRYILGLDFSARDLRLALVETADGKLGTFVDRILLRCFSYDAASGRYGWAIMAAVRLGGGFTLAGLIGGIVLMERRARARAAAGPFARRSGQA